MSLSDVEHIIHKIKNNQGDQAETIQQLAKALDALVKVVEEHAATIRQLESRGR